MPGNSRALRLIERALLAVGVVALAWYATAEISAAREQAALSRELDRGVAAHRDQVGTPSLPAVLPLRTLVGRIDIPRLRLSTVAREGVDTRTLRGSAGHVPGTALPGQPGNAAFAAHRDTFFRPLRGIRSGDDVRVTTTAGAFEYVVVGTRIVTPEEISVLDPTPDATLTLVTCYPFDYIGSAPQRFIVTARLVRSADPAIAQVATDAKGR